MRKFITLHANSKTNLKKKIKDSLYQHKKYKLKLIIKKKTWLVEQELFSSQKRGKRDPFLLSSSKILNFPTQS